jgi:hypothetical protein
MVAFMDPCLSLLTDDLSAGIGDELYFRPSIVWLLYASWPVYGLSDPTTVRELLTAVLQWGEADLCFNRVGEIRSVDDRHLVANEIEEKHPIIDKSAPIVPSSTGSSLPGQRRGSDPAESPRLEISARQPCRLH